MDYSNLFTVGEFYMVIIEFKVSQLGVFGPVDVFFLCLLKKCIFHYLINYKNTNSLLNSLLLLFWEIVFK